MCSRLPWESLQPTHGHAKMRRASACGDESLKTSSYSPGVVSSSFSLKLGGMGPSPAEVKLAVHPHSVGDTRLGQCWLPGWLMESGVSGGWLRDPPESGCNSCLFTLLTL